jgi:hypothetical protein
MISLVAILRAAKALLGIEQTVQEVVETAVELIDPEPSVKGVPLSHRDVDHIQAQIASACKPSAPKKI